MSREGSVAPKERVNIVYKADTNGLKEEIELPLKVMIVGEFTTTLDETRLEEKKTIDLNKNNFNDVMKEQKLKLNTTVENKILEPEEGDEGISMELTLDFEQIKDFEPDSIIQKVPELKKIYELRESLKALKGPLGNIPEFRKLLEKTIKDTESREKILKEINISEEE
jgi:type VI secretion system protein ImpB